MPVDPANTIHYQRARFSTLLPVERRYSTSHYWLVEVVPGRWRVGFTQFATRMLGDLVECNFSIGPEEPLAVGQSIGTVEGLKAVSELCSVASGMFAGSNAAIDEDPTLVDTDPYDRGWLYEVRGEPDPQALGAAEYAKLLNSIIDRLQAQSGHVPGGDACIRLDIF